MRTTASVLKQDPNAWKVQKNAYLLGHKHTICKFRGNILCQTTKHHLTVKWLKMRPTSRISCRMVPACSSQWHMVCVCVDASGTWCVFHRVLVPQPRGQRWWLVWSSQPTTCARNTSSDLAFWVTPRKLTSCEYLLAHELFKNIYFQGAHPAAGYWGRRNSGPLCWEPRANKCSPFKGQVQGMGWFLTRFPLKLAESEDVGETVV